MDAGLAARLNRAREELTQAESELSAPEVARDPSRLRELGKRRASLAKVIGFADDVLRLEGELKDAEELSADPEIGALAKEEAEGLRAALARAKARLKSAMLPKDPMADRPAVVEIRAGTGGSEAALFGADLMRMYRRLAEREGWTIELLSLSQGALGSVKEAVFSVRGTGAYGRLRFESGVHRVQRVPETESQGRVHTSAATVAVLPEAEEVDVKIDPSDLRIDVFRSSGPGGQSVNTTDSAVRITHVPTQLTVSCQDEKSQHKNKARAMKVLRSRLLDRMIAEKEAERAAARRSQVGTGDRSAKIRTYNFPQNRVTDHRIGLSLYRLGDILDGDLEEVLGALERARELERLAEEGMGE